MKQEQTLKYELEALKNKLFQLENALKQIPPTTPSLQTPSPQTFTFATCNVLYEPYYVQYIQPNNVLIPINQRLDAFTQALHNKNALKDVDIFCFQEWPYQVGQVRTGRDLIIIDNQQKQQEKRKYFEETYSQHLKFIERLSNVYSASDYHYNILIKESENDGVMTVINTKKFKIHQSFYEKFDANKKMLVVFITPLNEPLKVIGIINAHVPFKSPDHENSLLKIEATLKKYENSVAGWIICGDFNHNILSKNTIDQTKYTTLIYNMIPQAYKFPFQSNITWNNNPTSISPTGIPEINDYIFYTTNILKPLALSLFPESTNQLLRHVNQNPQEHSYFSDHAMVRMTFEIL